LGRTVCAVGWAAVFLMTRHLSLSGVNLLPQEYTQWDEPDDAAAVVAEAA
jgi:hypothetical protein